MKFDRKNSKPFARAVYESRIKIENGRKIFNDAYDRISQEFEAASIWRKPLILGSRISLLIQYKCRHIINLVKYFTVLGLYWLIQALIAISVAAGALGSVGLAILFFQEIIGSFRDSDNDGDSDFATTKSGLEAEASLLNHESFQSDFPRGSSSANSDAWRVAEDVVTDPEFWQLIGGAIDFFTGSEPKPVHVDPYTDKNGRFVPEHYRSLPNN